MLTQLHLLLEFFDLLLEMLHLLRAEIFLDFFHLLAELFHLLRIDCEVLHAFAQDLTLLAELRGEFGTDIDGDIVV